MIDLRDLEKRVEDFINKKGSVNKRQYTLLLKQYKRDNKIIDLCSSMLNTLEIYYTTISRPYWNDDGDGFDVFLKEPDDYDNMYKKGIEIIKEIDNCNEKKAKEILNEYLLACGGGKSFKILIPGKDLWPA